MAFSTTPGLYFEIPAAGDPTSCSAARDYLLRIKVVAEEAGMEVFEVPFTYRIIGNDLAQSFCVGGAGDVTFYQVAAQGQPEDTIKMLIDDLDNCCPDDTEPPPTCQDLVEILFPGRKKENLLDLGAEPSRNSVHSQVMAQVPAAFGNGDPKIVARVFNTGSVGEPPNDLPFTDFAFYLSISEDPDVPPIAAFSECEVPAIDIGGLLSQSITNKVEGGLLLKTKASVNSQNVAYSFLSIVLAAGKYQIQHRQITDSGNSALEFNEFDLERIGTQWTEASTQVSFNGPIEFELKGFVNEYSFHAWSPSTPGNNFHASFGVLKLRALQGELTPRTKIASWWETGSSGSNFFKVMNAAGNVKLVLKHPSIGSSPQTFVGATGQGARPAILGMTQSASGFGGSDIPNGTGWTRWASTGGGSVSLDAPICEPWMQFNPDPVTNIPGYCFGIMWDTMVMYRVNDFNDDDKPEPFRFDNQWWRSLTMGGTVGADSAGPRCSLAVRVRDLLTYTGNQITDPITGLTSVTTTGDIIRDLTSITVVPGSPITTPTTITVTVTLAAPVPISETVVVAVRSTRERAQFTGGGPSFLIRIPQGQTTGNLTMLVNDLETPSSESLVLPVLRVFP